MTKKLSISIPTFNRADYLIECLDSVICSANNFLDDVEIVIIDNHSEDNTEELVKIYQNKFSIIRFIRNESNIGFDRNIMRCIEAASGEYVWLIGDDDRIQSEAIEKILYVLNQNNDLSMVYVNHSVYDKKMINVIETSSVRNKTDILFANANDCLKSVGVRLTLISTLVLNRSLCLAVEHKDKYIGFGFIHLYIALSILPAHKSYLIADPLVMQRSGNTASGIDINYFDVFVKEISRILKAVKPLGYKTGILRRIVNHSIRYYIIRRLIYLKRVDAKRLIQIWPMLISYYYSYPLFWVAVFPIRFIPSIVLQRAYEVYKNIGRK